MLKSERQSRIVQIIKEKGFIRNAELRQLLDVTSATIRRDLKELSEQKLLHTEYGGAVDINFVAGVEEPLYQTKTYLNLDAKRRIGAAALAHIHDGDAIMLDSGTTTFQIALNLKNSRLHDLTVITYDVKIAAELCPEPAIRVILTGGILRTALYSAYGPFTESTLKNLHARTAFLAADGVNLGHGVVNSNLEEVPIKQLLLQHSEQVVLVADSSKFDKEKPFGVCDWNELDVVITDGGVPAAYPGFLDTKGIKLEIVPSNNQSNLNGGNDAD